MKNILKAILLCIGAILSQSSSAELAESESLKISQLGEKNPLEAIAYINSQLKLHEQSSITYLDYLYAKAELLTSTHNDKEQLNLTAEEGLKLSHSQDDRRYYAGFLNIRAIIEQNNGNYSESLKVAEQAIEIVQNSLKGNNGDDYLLGNAYSIKGRSYYYSGDFNEAAIAWKKSYDFFDKGNFHKLKIFIINDLGNLASSLGNFDESIRHFEEALAYFSERNMEASTGAVLFNLGLNYRSNGKLDKAVEYFTKAKQVGEKYDDTLTQAHTNQLLGEVAGIQGNYELAEKYLREATGFFHLSGNFSKEFSARIRLTETLIYMNEFDKARQNLKQASSQLERVQNDGVKLDFIRVEAVFYEKQKNFEKSLEKYKEFHNKYEQLINEANQKKIHEMTNKFTNERERAKNKLLEKKLALEKSQTQNEAQKKQNIQELLLIAVFAFLLLLYLFNKQYKLKQRLALQALEDELTGSFNRRAILEKAEEQFNTANRYKSKLTVGICDLDHFKQVNDTYGHDAGDQVLKAFAKASLDSIRNVDYFGRFGGEEWLFIFPNTSAEEISIIVERIKNNLLKIELPLPKTPTFSLGITTINEQDKSILDIIKRADEAMYQAKESGRDRIVKI